MEATRTLEDLSDYIHAVIMLEGEATPVDLPGTAATVWYIRLEDDVRTLLALGDAVFDLTRRRD